MTGPSLITNPSPAGALLVRRPRCQVWIDGRLIFSWLELTTTRGLDQDLATADITFSHPLPDWVRWWSKVVIVAGVTRFTERFTGYVTGFEAGLWPGTKVVHCQDVLAIAANSFPKEEVNLGSFLDSAAVREVLFGCNYNENTFIGIDALLSGTGYYLVDVEEAQLFWEVGQSGLEAIQGIDEISLGWRTYATAGGNIVRTLINTDPNTVEVVHAFAEGVDILDGSESIEIEDPRNEITVTGFDGSVTATLDPDDDPFAWWKNSYWKRYRILQTQARQAGIIDPQLVAEYILSQIGKQLIHVTFSTHLDTPFRGQEVITLTSERLEVDQNFWVQSVQTVIGTDGSFTQTITGVSALEPTNRHYVTPPVEEDEDSPVEPPGPDEDIPAPEPPTPTEPTESDVLVDFTIVAIDRELAGVPADTGDLGSAHYIVSASDTSTSSTASPNSFTRDWAAAGPGVTVAAKSGLDPTFTTAFTDLAGAEITLTITDGNGSSASKTLPVEGNGVVRSRKLYAYTEDTYEAYDGEQWRQQPPSIPTKVQALGGGPYWGADHYFVVSTDDLASAPSEVAALPPGEDVLCIWPHETNTRLFAIGGANGSVAISTDGGATWTQKTSLGEAVHGIIISIFREEELHVVTPSGWYTSHNQGDSWELVRAGDFLYLELSHTRNIVVTNAGQLQVAETGAAFTGNSSPIKAATAHIRQDKFYAIAEDGTTWVQDAEGSLTLVAGEPIPDGEVVPGGAYRDSQVIDMVFFAAGDGGIFKTCDGFATPEGYLRLRTPGRLTP